MAKATHAIPPGMSSVTPHLCFKDAAKVIDFYKKAFGAEELARVAVPDGRLMHACLKIGGSTIFLVDEFPEHSCEGASMPSGSSNLTLHLFVEDVDAAYKQAVDAGAKGVMPPQDMFWGDRYGRLVDPFGQQWSIATHKEDLTPQEIERNMAQAFAMQKEAAKA